MIRTGSVGEAKKFGYAQVVTRNTKEETKSKSPIRWLDEWQKTSRETEEKSKRETSFLKLCTELVKQKLKQDSSTVLRLVVYSEVYLEYRPSSVNRTQNQWIEYSKSWVGRMHLNKIVADQILKTDSLDLKISKQQTILSKD